jgi:hypothetical protein
MHPHKVTVHTTDSDRNSPLKAVRTSPPEPAVSVGTGKPSSRETEYHEAMAFLQSPLAANPPTSLSRHDLRRYRLSMLIPPFSSLLLPLGGVAAMFLPARPVGDGAGG